MKRILAAMGCTLIALTISCKQGEGDACQIDDDCEQGLECNAGTMRCQRPGSGLFDAAPITDAPIPIDASPLDAGIADADAGTADAGFDAAPAVTP